jgi:SAM-dependent methyltransferase
MPFFSKAIEAERYAQNRPYFHPLAIAQAKEATGIDKKVPLALDVACGTGQSSSALKAIAERVIGFDISWNMMANAERDEGVWYVQARSESMPFSSGSAAVMTCALAFHWFDRDHFLREAWRVLGVEGLLLIYNNGFTGIMRENLAFQNWSQNAYPKRFPTPPRDSKPISPEEASDSGFDFIKKERYENEVRFTPEALAAYLTTQTNVVAAVELGRESFTSANRWLLEQVRPFFTESMATFVFATRAWYLRKKVVPKYY